MGAQRTRKAKGYTLMAPDAVPMIISRRLGSQARAVGLFGKPCCTVWKRNKSKSLLAQRWPYKHIDSQFYYRYFLLSQFSLWKLCFLSKFRERAQRSFTFNPSDATLLELYFLWKQYRQFVKIKCYFFFVYITRQRVAVQVFFLFRSRFSVCFVDCERDKTTIQQRETKWKSISIGIESSKISRYRLRLLVPKELGRSRAPPTFSTKVYVYAHAARRGD